LTTGRFPRLAVAHTLRNDGAVYLGPFPGVAAARFVRSAIEAALPLRLGTGDVVALVRRALSGEHGAIVGPLAERVEALTAAGRAGDAAFAREQLRALSGALRRQALLDGLHSSGRMTVDVAGHHIELDGGRLVAVDQGTAPLPLRRSPDGRARPGSSGRAEADEILAVGRWLRREARAGRVGVVGPVEAAQAAALAAVLEGADGGSA
jgi:hypothetical protein